MAERVTIAIDLELTEPVSGSVVSEGDDPVHFSGWLQLHSALESICEEAREGLAEEVHETR
jgi:hypothetical protein